MDADETVTFTDNLVHTHSSTNSVRGYSLIVGEGHESCKHSKFCRSPLSQPDLPTAALRMFRWPEIKKSVITMAVLLNNEHSKGSTTLGKAIPKGIWVTVTVCSGRC